MCDGGTPAFPPGRRRSGSTRRNASGPLTRITPMPPKPGGVPIAAIVSFCIAGLYSRLQRVARGKVTARALTPSNSKRIRVTAGTYPSCQRCCAASAPHSGKTKGEGSPLHLHHNRQDHRATMCLIVKKFAKGVLDFVFDERPVRRVAIQTNK